MAKVVGSWEGGRVKETSSGKRVFYIRKRIRGKLYEVSTGATTLKAALSHLQRFEANPEAYDPTGALPGKPLTIRAFQKEYLDACKVKGNSTGWIAQKRRYLSWWGRVFPGDLRTLTREKALALIATTKGQTHGRIASLKAFCSWLRDERGLLPKAQDVTLDIPVGSPKPAQWSRKRAITRDVFQKTLEKIDPVYVDIVTLLGGTGMHVREALRLAQGQGSIEDNVLTIFHKNGFQHRMIVDPQIAEAARKVFNRNTAGHRGRKGGFSDSRLREAIHEACDKAGVPRWAPGGLRHSFVTWMVGDGASVDAVATYTNHDPATLRRYYNVAPIPLPVVPLAKAG